jgi:hypothetical protein
MYPSKLKQVEKRRIKKMNSKEKGELQKKNKLMITPISILSWVVLFFVSRIDANLNSSQSINGNSPK